MSAYSSNILRKRRSDDESSDIDENVPPVKKQRQTPEGTSMFPFSLLYIRKFFASKCQDLMNWFSEKQINLNKPTTMIYTQPTVEGIDSDNIENQDVLLLDDEEEEEIAKLTAGVEKKSFPLLGSDSSLNMSPKPITTSTPVYRDGTLVGFKPNVPQRNGYHSKDLKAKDFPRKSQKQPRSSHRCITPITNPGTDIEILLDSRELNTADSKELEIVSEIRQDKCSSKFYRPLMSPIPVFDVKPTDTSHRSVMNGKDPSTSKQNSKTFSYGYTANEVVRLQEKAQYEKLLKKIVNDSVYRPVVKKKVTAIEVDLTKDEDEESAIGLPFSREYLAKPVGDLLEKYYKPMKLVTKTGSQSEQSREVNGAESNVVLPQYRSKILSKADFFSKTWIDELKTAINEETEKRLMIVRQEEAKLKRYKERRDAKIEEQRLLFEKYKVPGDVFPEPSTVRNDYPKLTPEMENMINDAMKPMFGRDMDKMCSMNGITILRKHMTTLEENSWLNDEILNFYLNLIVERSKLDNYPSVYTFNTFFYTSLRGRGVSSVLRWTRKVDIFSYDLLFIPLHLDVHWALCIVDNRTKAIKLYDSMAGNEEILKIVHLYLISEMQAKKNIVMDPNEYTLEIVKNVPKQMNGSDCGVFTLKYAEYISRDAPLTFEQAHMPYFRRRTVYEILTKQLL